MRRATRTRLLPEKRGPREGHHPTLELLQSDAGVFLHRSLSAPCMPTVAKAEAHGWKLRCGCRQYNAIPGPRERHAQNRVTWARRSGVIMGQRCRRSRHVISAAFSKHGDPPDSRDFSPPSTDGNAEIGHRTVSSVFDQASVFRHPGSRSGLSAGNRDHLVDVFGAAPSGKVICRSGEAL